MEISISNHQLFTIASDGSPIDAITVDGIVVSGGERYDFVVSADKPIGNYAIQVRGVDGSECEGIEEVAILRYEGASQEMKPSPTKEGDGVILNVPIVESTPGRPGVYDLRDAGKISDGFRGRGIISPCAL